MPVNAVQPCPALEPVNPALDMGKLLQVAIDTADAYNLCKARHDALRVYNEAQ